MGPAARWPESGSLLLDLGRPRDPTGTGDAVLLASADATRTALPIRPTAWRRQTLLSLTFQTPPFLDSHLPDVTASPHCYVPGTAAEQKHRPTNKGLRPFRAGPCARKKKQGEQDRAPGTVCFFDTHPFERGGGARVLAFGCGLNLVTLLMNGT